MLREDLQSITAQFSLVDTVIDCWVRSQPPDTTPLHRPSPPQNWEQADMNILTQSLAHLLSPCPDICRQANKMLFDYSTKANHFHAVLCIITDPVTDTHARQAATAYFLDQVEAIPEEEMKDLFISLFESLDFSFSSEFSFSRGMYGFANIILRVLDSLSMRFRYEFKTPEIMLNLKFCIEEFADRLSFYFFHVSDLIERISKRYWIAEDFIEKFWVEFRVDDSRLPLNHEIVVSNYLMSLLFESGRLCCSIFLSWNFIELHAYFEKEMDDWMIPQLTILDIQKNLYLPDWLESNTVLELFDKVREAVCENITLYVDKYGEEFQAYLGRFVKLVLRMLLTVSQEPGHDQLVITAIKVLTTVSTSVHHHLFAGDSMIPLILRKIVIPNVKLRDDDKDLLDMNYMEFIKRDMEGSDLDSRRRIACELLKGIATNYKPQVTNLVSAQIQNLLTSFAANPDKNWKDMDCAINLVVSLATNRAGGTSVTTDLVDVLSFFQTVIVPVLQSQDVNGYPRMLKAGALKFFTMFWNHIPKPMTSQLFPDLIQFLRAESSVVHSYAASCIEKLLLVKDEGGQTRYTSVDISPLLPQLMRNLFEALRVRGSDKNQYVMKCIMRVLGVADMSREIVGSLVTELTSILNKACEDTKNPVFKHYVFESVAVLVKRACGKDASFISTFEVNLFPGIYKILIENFQDPYGLQLLAVLVELSGPPISQSYMQIFSWLLSPELWKKASKVPALVCLLQAFLQKAPHELNQESRLRQVLEISYKLVSSAKTEKHGFNVLNTVIQSLDFDVIGPYIGKIWIFLFTLLQSRPTRKFIISLLVFMSLFVVKYGSTNLVDSVNGIQANLFLMILQRFWIPNLVHVTGVIQTKVTVVASTRALCESHVLLDEHWGKLLNSILSLLSRTEQDRVETDLEMPDFAENVGYSATYVRMHNAGKTEDDPLKEITDAEGFLVTSLATLSKFSCDRYPHIIHQYVGETNQAKLFHLCSIYNCQIV